MIGDPRGWAFRNIRAAAILGVSSSTAVSTSWNCLLGGTLALVRTWGYSATIKEWSKKKKSMSTRYLTQTTLTALCFCRSHCISLILAVIQKHIFSSLTIKASVFSAAQIQNVKTRGIICPPADNSGIVAVVVQRLFNLSITFLLLSIDYNITCLLHPNLYFIMCKQF